MSGLKGTLGRERGKKKKKKLNSYILGVAFKVRGIKGEFVLIDHTPSLVEAWP